MQLHSHARNQKRTNVTVQNNNSCINTTVCSAADYTRPLSLINSDKFIMHFHYKQHEYAIPYQSRIAYDFINE